MISSDFSGKKVMVCGGAGFIGTNLILSLQKTSAEIFTTFYQKKLQIETDNITVRECDLTTETGCMRAAEGMDFIIMCAANSSGAAVMEKTPLAHLTPNLIMNALMLEAAYKAGVKKFCFISSNTVYPVSSSPMQESDSGFEFFEKYHIVGWMKKFSEIMCDMYSNKIKEPMKTIVVRPGNLYGPFDKYSHQESKVIAALIRRAVERHDPFPLWGDGEDIKDFLFIDDFIEALLLTLKSANDIGPINIASGVPITINKVLEEILSITGHDGCKVERDITKPTMIPERLIDISKAHTELNWYPSVSIRDGLSKTIKWYNEYFKDSTPT